MLKTILKTLGAATVVGLISCSATETIYVTPALPLPACDARPVIEPNEFECLKDEVYSRFRQRENIYKKCLGEMRAVIKSTH